MNQIAATAFSHPSITNRGHVVVWPGFWSRSRIILEIDLREERAQRYITGLRKRALKWCAVRFLIYCLVWWLI